MDKHLNFVSHTKLTEMYGIQCNFLDVLKIRQCIPYEWKQLLNASRNTCSNNISSNLVINIGSKPVSITKIRCKYFYWHLIGIVPHKPTPQEKWQEMYDGFKTADECVWPRIYKLAFTVTKESKLQSFQYKILHRNIACNKRLFDIKVKKSSKCELCDCEDNLQHFFLHCEHTAIFWKIWFKWWERITSIDISRCNSLDERILFGFPEEDNLVYVMNFCIIFAKYFIYITKICGSNTFDFYTYNVQLKQKLKMEKNASTNFEYNELLENIEMSIS